MKKTGVGRRVWGVGTSSGRPGRLGDTRHPTPHTRGRLRGVFLAALGLALAACTPAAARDEARVTLRFWAMGREGEVVRELVPEFERRHPGVRVRVQQMPWTAAHEKLLTAFVGEATPDLAQLGNTWVPEFQALNALEPLGARVARSPSLDSTDYFSGVWSTNVVADTLFGVPWYVDTRVLFYRSDILGAAGVTAPPRSWDEWRADLRRVVEGKHARWGILLPTNEWNQLTALALQQGAPLLKDGGRYGDFRDPRFVRAFDFYLSFFHDGLAPALSNTQIANMYQEFERGTFAMFVGGPWQVGELRTRLPDSLQGKWTTAPLPSPDGRDYPGLSLAGGSSLVLFRGSEHKAEAWQLLEFLSEPAQQAKFAKLTGDLPARESAWRLAGLDTDPQQRAFLEQLRRVAPTPKVPEWEQIATNIFETSERVVRGRQPEAQALAALDAQVDAKLEKRRWLLARR